MAFSEIYVDPSIAADSGAGTIGDPYGDLEYAIEQETFDLTNGTRVNIKAGTAEFIAAPLETAMADVVSSIAWVPVRTAHLVFRGYTALAGDGGEAEIDCGGTSRSVYGGAGPYISFVDIHGHNCGSTTAILRLANHSAVIRCHLHDVVGRAILFTADGLICGNYVHDVQGSGIDSAAAMVYGNRVSNAGTKEMTNGINLGSVGGTALQNIVDVDGATIGINMIGASTFAVGNSVFSAAGSGSGIKYADTIDRAAMIANNNIEGFSAVGGIGIEAVGSQTSIIQMGANSIFDCETEVDGPPLQIVDGFNLATPNEVLTESPFTDAANGDFSPVDTGAVKEGAQPQFYTI